jgi:CheY-like chemotaxis protein
MGIPPEMIASVFEMFTQVGRTIERSQGGLGIGLTLVRRLVEMHGGLVHAASPGVGLGTTFTVRLPLAEEVTLTAAAHASEGSGQSAALRVLVVDDNLDAAECLAMLLELSGHQTALAHTGPEAVSTTLSFQPDVVFLDIGLPELNGYEVAQRIRSDSSISQPMLVALTGWGSDEDKRQAQAAGFDRHLVKPFDASKLDALLSVRSARAR